MAGRGTCRGRATGGTHDACTVAEEREVRQEMPMCRHVHTLPSNGTERQLCELQRLMCEQNRLLHELLQTMRERNG